VELDTINGDQNIAVPQTRALDRRSRFDLRPFEAQARFCAEEALTAGTIQLLDAPLSNRQECAPPAS
jgi:hypothetical protein